MLNKDKVTCVQKVRDKNSHIVIKKSDQDKRICMLCMIIKYFSAVLQDEV